MKGLNVIVNWGRLRELEVKGAGVTPLTWVSVEDARRVLRAAPRLESMAVRLMFYPNSRVPEGFGKVEGLPGNLAIATPEAVTVYELVGEEHDILAHAVLVD